MSSQKNHAKVSRQLPKEAAKENQPAGERPQKAWTVMVYLAADTTLTNFAVESLKQMKARQSDRINIVAELDLGQRVATERYFFGEPSKVDVDRHAHVHFLEAATNPDTIVHQMTDPLSSISNNMVMQLEAQNVGDAETLTNFIDWSVREYPAIHYFLIIWGHGSGIDDSIPDGSGHELQAALQRDQLERFFIPRHRPLQTTDLKPDTPELKSLAFVDPTYQLSYERRSKNGPPRRSRKAWRLGKEEEEADLDS